MNTKGERKQSVETLLISTLKKSKTGEKRSRSVFQEITGRGQRTDNNSLETIYSSSALVLPEKVLNQTYFDTYHDTIYVHLSELNDFLVKQKSIPLQVVLIEIY